MNQINSASRKAIYILAGVLVVVLAGIYIGGIFLIPPIIKTSHAHKNCDLVLKLNDFYSQVYPSSLANKDIKSQVDECALYLVAIGSETEKDWQKTYSAFKTYESTFPQSIFTEDSHEHAALALTALGREQASQKKYDEAIGSLNGVLDQYADTTAGDEANELMIDVYTHWGEDLQTTGDFEAAEKTFKGLKAWAENKKQTAAIQSAKNQLAKTYLSWGMAFQSQNKFEEAKTRFDLAISTDPEPASATAPAIQARAAQAELQKQWGDSLIEQKNFADGIEHYKTALNFSDQPGIKDHMLNAYLKWATSLSDANDFLAALKQVDDTEKNASTDAAKKSISDTRDAIYHAFSMSDGEAAQKAIEEVLRTICVDHKRPTMPIFGLDKDHILAGAYGAELEIKLLDSVAATTPGAMHYVACIEQESKIIAKSTINNYGEKPATLVREQYIWHVTLWKMDTMGPNQSAQTQEFDLMGGMPPPFPSSSNMTHEEWMDILFGGSYQHFRGTPPSMDDFAKKLLLVMK